MAMVLELLTTPAMRALVEELRFFIVPVLNPDGYVYTFEGGATPRVTKGYSKGPLW
jgi:murein tripeptide amidase MpaA